MNFSPNTKRNIKRIIPFGLIWLFTGWVFLFVETAAMGTHSPDSPTIINLTLQVFLFASIAVTIVGFFVGFIEMVYLENLFSDKSFLQKFLLKLLIYSLIMLSIVFITYPIAAAFESNISIFHQQVWEKFIRYLTSITFFSTGLQLFFSLLLCLIYAAISENIGNAVLVNFLTGKYHKPKEEERIFMFLDMRSSTTVAEKLGHVKYFELLQTYYNSLSDAIINHYGEVYQYIGDEIVISWNYKKGFKNNNCINSFFAMRQAINSRADFFKNRFGTIPSFKAGMHCGKVTTGEIGALKKEIFFTGDVLNTTARIQSMCKDLNTDFLISEDLMKRLKANNNFISNPIGEVELKGKAEVIQLFHIEKGKKSKTILMQ